MSVQAARVIRVGLGCLALAIACPPAASGQVWAPNSRQLVYSVDSGVVTWPENWLRTGEFPQASKTGEIPKQSLWIGDVTASSSVCIAQSLRVVGQPVWAPDANSLYYLAWSPDSDQAEAGVSPGGTLQLIRQQRSGQLTTLRTFEGVLTSPHLLQLSMIGGAVRPDGLALAIGWVAPVQLSILDLTTGKVLAEIIGGSSPSWAPDSRTLAYFRTGLIQGVYSAGAPNWQQDRLAISTPKLVQPPVWDSMGSSFTVAWTTDVLASELKSVEVRRVFLDGRSTRSLASFSETDLLGGVIPRSLVIRNQESFTRRSTLSGSVQREPPGDFQIAWDDGYRRLFLAYRAQHDARAGLLSLEDNAFEPLRFAPAVSASGRLASAPSSPRFSPDGARLAYRLGGDAPAAPIAVLACDSHVATIYAPTLQAKLNTLQVAVRALAYWQTTPIDDGLAKKAALLPTPFPLFPWPHPRSRKAGRTTLERIVEHRRLCHWTRECLDGLQMSKDKSADLLAQIDLVLAYHHGELERLLASASQLRAAGKDRISLERNALLALVRSQALVEAGKRADAEIALQNWEDFNTQLEQLFATEKDRAIDTFSSDRLQETETDPREAIRWSTRIAQLKKRHAEVRAEFEKMAAGQLSPAPFESADVDDAP